MPASTAVSWIEDSTVKATTRSNDPAAKGRAAPDATATGRPRSRAVRSRSGRRSTPTTRVGVDARRDQLVADVAPTAAEVEHVELGGAGRAAQAADRLGHQRGPLGVQGAVGLPSLGPAVGAVAGVHLPHPVDLRHRSRPGPPRSGAVDR